MRRSPYFALCLILFAGLSFVPSASAANTCGDSATVSAGGLHVRAIGIRSQVWQESNGLPGLQTAQCASGTHTYGADTFLAQGVPQDLGILGVCAFTPVLAQCI